MKISIWLFAFALLLVVGCAHQPPRGGSSDEALGGSAQGQGFSEGQPGSQDYREVLSDPGPF